MTPFRGSDEELDREIAAVEGIARIRVRRTAEDLRELERDLRELRRERARRAGRLEALSSSTASAEAKA